MTITNLTPEKEKSAANAEKKKMKLIQEQNEQNKDSSFIDGCLSKHFILNSLDKKDKQELIKQMSLYSIKANCEIFRQGDTPGCFYILKEGTCDLIINGDIYDYNNTYHKFFDTGSFEVNCFCPIKIWH